MKKVLVSLLAACTLTVGSLSTTGCIGKFAAFNGFREWNQKLTGNKFINWIVFFVLNCIGVYGILLFVDGLVLNSIEFWTGKNPIAAGDTYYEKNAEGNSVTAVKMEDGSLYMKLETKEGQTQEIILQQDEDLVRVLDTQGNVIKQAAYLAE